jgi:peptidyl-prolyl cis-trans isomerase D
MLQAIRDKAQGWIAWAIVILISVPFALWGIQEYLGVGAEPMVATVNGNEITERDLDRRARDFRENLRVTLGSAYRPDLISEEDLRAQVRERMIDERVLLDAARAWGMRAGDDLVRRFIQSIPGFQQDGGFNQGVYDAVLRNRGMSPPMFEESVRQDLILNQVREAVRGSGFVTERELAEAARLEYQRRGIAYVLIPAEPYEAEVAVSDEALEAYYREHADQFMVPEQVSVQYLLLDLGKLAEQVPVDAQRLEQYFQQHAVEFRVPEQRHVRHILVAFPAGADEAAEAKALAEAQALHQRLTDGEDFAAVAREASADPGSAQNGGDLGWIEPGMMVAPFEEAAFGLAQGELSEPVRSQFGFHLIEVTEVRAGDEGDFASVRDKVEASFRRTEAEHTFYDFAERLADLAFENPGSLAPAAETLGLELQTTGLFSRDAPPAALQDPKAINAAFSAEVLERGNNSELLELDPSRALVLRVLEHEPEHLRPLAEVRDEVGARYRRMKAAEAAAQAGQEALQGLQEGQSLATLAEAKGWSLERVSDVRRDDARLPPPLIAKVFELPPPQAGAVSRGGVILGQDYAVVEVHDAKDAVLDELNESDTRVLRNRLSNQAETGEFTDFLATLRSEADIEIPAAP